MSLKQLRVSFFSALALFVAVIAAPGAAHATLGDAIINTIASSSDVPGLFSGFSYLFGIVLGVLGIGKIYEHVQSPQQVPIWDGLKRMLAGGAFFALPIVLEAAETTLDPGNLADASQTGFAGVTSAGGLDAMLVALIGDIWQPMLLLISGFGYLAGIVLIMIGIMRMLKGMQDGVKGPGGIGTIMTFIAGAALFALDALMGAWNTSMFGSNVTTTIPELQYTAGMTAAEIGHAHAVFSAVIAFMIILGFVSFVRGIFILRSVAEGDQQASMMAAVTHIFGGALAVNLGPLLNAIQTTLGIAPYGLIFL